MIIIPHLYAAVTAAINVTEAADLGMTLARENAAAFHDDISLRQARRRV